MHISHLSLINFRNYLRLELDLPRGTVLLRGDNAQGKTNLLEAIFYLATTRSPRAQTDGQLVNWLAEKEDLPFARLDAQVWKEGASQKIEVVLVRRLEEKGASPRWRKIIKINGVPRRVRDLVGQIKVVLFLPEDIDLIADSPSQRRRYLDITLCQIDPRYYEELQRYSRLLIQRNHLLRQLRERQGSPEQLNVWDDGLVRAGTYLVVRRQEVVTRLDHFLEQVHPDLTGQQERLRLFYKANLKLDEEPGHQLPLGFDAQFSKAFRQPQLDARRVKDAFRQQLRQVRGKEMALGMTTVGPHRDDLRFLIDGVDMTIYGSRAQQRTTALSLKLAEAELMRAETGEEPIVLLDDVMSELDQARRQYLSQLVKGEQQAIFTTTDLSDYPPQFRQRALLLEVCGGMVWRVEEEGVT